jgi:hypothetical protein
LHRRRSVVVRMDEEGQVLGIEQVLNDPVQLSMAVAKAGPGPRWPWRALMGGTGRLTCSRPTVPMSTSYTLLGSTGARGV